jgi:hypothetical protein
MAQLRCRFGSFSWGPGLSRREAQCFVFLPSVRPRQSSGLDGHFDIAIQRVKQL